ncbi:MAG: glycoside hydrolase family 20 zincin-like fold domain-containing protein [Bryobacteraceae bacterium]
MIREIRHDGLIVLVFWCMSCAQAASPSPLFARGYTVIPEPQKIELSGDDFAFGNGWRLVLDSGVGGDLGAVEILRDDLASRHGVYLETASKSGSASKTIRLAIKPGSVTIGSATDRDKDKLAEEAYRLDLSPQSIVITANAPPGLLYGAETLVQLVKVNDDANWLPTGRITDWPDLQNRFIYWDGKAHLDRIDVLRDMLRQAAFYKVNGVLIKLNAHFQYASAPAVVEPYALTPGELQELTDYGLRYHVQMIPYIDGPAHIAWILKHPELEKLRAFPESNYEICTTNPDSYKLLEGMYQELMDANKGVKYFLLSTDEPYYVGLANNPQCNEADETKKLGSVGKVLAEFITKAAGYLHDHGRTVIFWGEYPLKPADIPTLPPYLINGEVYGPEFDRAFREHGIRQMIFTYTQASEPLFPNYYLLPETEQVDYVRASQADEAHFRPTADRISQTFNEISFWGARDTADMMGVDVCAWGDEGLHPETFWLGFATAAGWIWHPGSPDPAEAKSSFYRLFYGRHASNIDRLYQLMSTQAEFWASSWEWGPSSIRPVLFGDSNGIRPIPPRDQVISLPSVSEGDYLRLNFDWAQANQKRLQLAEKSLADNDELLALLNRNLGSVQLHRYNLEVFLSIAKLYRQNLEMLQDLGAISASLRSAETAAAKLNYNAAASALDQAMQIAYVIRAQRNRALQNATTTWYKSWYPRVPEANGRRYLLVLNSVQDYRVDRTLGLSYLIQREFLLPFGSWFKQLQQIRNRYATAHQLPEKTLNFDWQDDASTSLGSSY